MPSSSPRRRSCRSSRIEFLRGVLAKSDRAPRLFLCSCLRIVSRVQFVHMKVVSTTTARKNISRIVDQVKIHGEVFGIGRRNSIDALIIQFPAHYRADVNDITNVNALSHSFDFLNEEPELYSVADLKKRYA